MSNPTAQSAKQPSPRRPDPQRRRKAQRTATTFRKQTARLEGRRDGTPLIFGWGGHLTRAQKSRIQRNAAYSFFGVVTALVLGVFVFGLLQQTVFIPNQTILSVNGVSVSQDTYRKLLAYNAQDLWNQLQANIKTHDQLSDKLVKGDNSVTTALTIATNNVQVEEGNYSQATITQNTADQLTEDQLIQQEAVRFEQQDKTAKDKFTPKSSDINKKFADFKTAFPSNEKYSDFVAKNGLSDDDVKSAVALHLRRDLMQTYLASRLTSPTRQVHLRDIETTGSDDSQARKILSDMQAQKLLATSASWSDIAKKQSVDTNTKDQGGDMGWVIPGTGDAGIELWAYDPARKVGDYAVVKTAGGTWNIMQVLGIDPSRPVDGTTLKNTQDNALSHYLGGWRINNRLSTPDSTLLQASRNLPQVPDLSAQLPNYNPQQGTGAPGGVPGLP